MEHIIQCYDLFAFNGLHSGFNIGLLDLIDNAYAKKTIKFFSEKNLNDIVKEKFNNRKIDFEDIKILNNPKVGGKYTLIRDIKSCLVVLKAFLSKSTDIYFFIAYPFASMLISLMSYFTNKNVFLILHGEMEVYVKNGCFERNRRYYSLNKGIFKNRNINFVLLGNSIYNSVSYLFKKKPIVINLPYTFDTKVDTKYNPGILRVVMLGSGDKSKGADKFINIANSFSKEIKNKLISFEIVGKLANNMLNEITDNVVWHSELLSNDEYFEKIRTANIVLLLKDDSIKAIASATFLDALAFGIPFFSIRNEYIESYCNEFMQENCIFQDIDQIEIQLRKLLYDKESENKLFFEKCITEIIEIRKQFSIEINKPLFLSQLR